MSPDAQVLPVKMVFLHNSSTSRRRRSGRRRRFSHYLDPHVPGYATTPS
jgi:hypothetical protein